MKRKVLFILAVFLSCRSAEAFTLSHFDSPESVQADPDEDSYYVSNINGGPTERDGNGFISKFSANGNMVIHKFIGGKGTGLLDAPKGMAIVGDKIYVADIDRVKVFDKKTRRGLAVVDLSRLHAKFLNDVAADSDRELYVSDTVTNQIFKLDLRKNLEATVYQSGTLLGHPNGLVVHPKSHHLIEVGWESGQIQEIDPAGRIHVLKRVHRALDGVDYDREGNLYVASYETGEIFKISHMGRGVLTTFMSGLTTPADISFSRKQNEILIPSMKANTVSAIPLSQIENHT